MDPKERQAIRRQRLAETDRLEPVVTITLKGHTYTLECNNYAVKGILKDTGYNLMSEGFSTKQLQDPEVMGSMLNWLLKTHHPDLSVEDTDKLYTFRHYPYIIERIGTSIDLFLPDMSDIDSPQQQSKPVNDEDPPKPSAANGLDTGPLPVN